MSTVKLTQYSHGAGCGCKISPQTLQTILAGNLAEQDNNLLVGNHSNDDAAVYDLGDGSALISTTDFFMPIADDPMIFGEIAAANAISDVYAMGGTPLMAIAILGWPIDKLAPEVAQQVIKGGRNICAQAGISLAGGHSIDSPEPIFGLAVTGRVNIAQLKRNDSATAGDVIFLTKPLGVGVLTTAQKQGLLAEKHQHIATDSMRKLNSIGAKLATLEGVTALTDVTGFGLAGHLYEVTNGAQISAQINCSTLPLLPEVEHYIELGCIAGGSKRNFASYHEHICVPNNYWQNIVCDPQTSGGLLVAVKPQHATQIAALLAQNSLPAEVIGKFIESNDLSPRIEFIG
ncbi:selenide, water dikinase SelD [Reinekea sp.]|jgi:selenide,water dikinase|uniref:selenide, water dikinase SelD n=1 Tax=Reinekea sp. TaxID=1970455 RepID=UPI003989EE8A